MTEQQPEAQSSSMAQAEPTSYGKPLLRVSYKVPFSLRVRYAITSIAHFFRIMPQSPNYIGAPEFLPITKGRRVESYSESLHMLYVNPETVQLARDHWKVTEIMTYKDYHSNFEHEYLVATLRDGGAGKVLLRIERRIQDSSAKEFYKDFTQPGRRSRRRTQDAAQPNYENERALFQKNAVDEVTLVPKLSDVNKHELVEHIVFRDEEHRVSLPQLIVLACTINDYSNKYQVIAKNCYWFCYIIGELLERLSPASRPDLSARSRQGTWLGLPTGALWRSVKFDEVLKKYNVMWKEFEDKVWSITEDLGITDAIGSWKIESFINHPANKNLKAAREQVEEEKKRTEEEKKRAEEEKKRAEEEKKRAEEEKKRAEEAERRAEASDKRADEMEHRIAELEAKLAQSKGKGPSNVFSRQ
jgi:hypothetical protein